MRWTVCEEACVSMIDNYSELMDLWDWSLDIIKDTEMKAWIQGVRSYMQTFNLYFGCALGKLLLIQTTYPNRYRNWKYLLLKDKALLTL